MQYLPFWQGGLALAAVPVLHWLFLRRALAVSGRITALVDRVRSGPPHGDHGDHGDGGAAAMTDAELLEAIRRETEAQFGEAAVEPVAGEATTVVLPQPRAREPWSTHALFFAGIVLGGLGVSLASGTFSLSSTLRGELFSQLLGGSPATRLLALSLGGALVGFGTRMAGGCTSGHGLCGVSQLQPGSLLATASFFGAAVLTSLLLAGLG